jgi:polyphosphate glucokinase
MNDAAMTALGCVDDRGTDLVVALGTGFGVAVTQNGRLVDVPDYGTLTLEGDDSYDVLLGEAARSRDMDAWTSRVIDVVAQLARKHDADVVHLAGGNARRLSERHFDAQDVPVRIDRGDPAIRGAWVAWRQ